MKRKRYDKGGPLLNIPSFITDVIKYAPVDSEIKEVSVSAPKLHNQHKFFNYTEPQAISNRRYLQDSIGQKETGQFNKLLDDTIKENSRRFDTRENANYAKEQWQNRIKEEASKATNFTANEEYINSIKTPHAKQSQCIAGICNFLDTIEPNTFKHGMDNPKYYHSNFTFEKNAKKEGWQQFKSLENNDPQIGDIFQSHWNGGRHAVMVYDITPDGKYKIIDNNGDGEVRRKDYTREELEYKYLPNKSSSFFRREKFDDNSVRDPYQQDLKEYKIKEENDNKPFQIYGGEKGKHSDYIKGINKNLETVANKSNIPQEDLEKLAIIAGSLPYAETEAGDGIKYKIETSFPEETRLARFFKSKGKKGLGESLSVGISQLNPKSLPDDIKRRYFTDARSLEVYSDKKIERKLRNNQDLAGEVTLDLLMDRYNKFQDDPTLYNNDPEKFWYLLTKSWQSPYYGAKEENKEYIDNYNVDYSNKVFDNLNKINVKKYNNGGLINTIGQVAPLADLAMPGLGSALSIATSFLGGRIQEDQLNKNTVQSLTQKTVNTNPFGFANGGFLLGNKDFGVYKGKLHTSGGISVSAKGTPTKNGINEVEGGETKFTYKGQDYIFSDQLKIK